jgi:hypothetical protein
MARAKVVEAELGAHLALDELTYAAGLDRVSGVRRERNAQRPLARVESRP